MFKLLQTRSGKFSCWSEKCQGFFCILMAGSPVFHSSSRELPDRAGPCVATFAWGGGGGGGGGEVGRGGHCNRDWKARASEFVGGGGNLHGGSLEVLCPGFLKRYFLKNVETAFWYIFGWWRGGGGGGSKCLIAPPLLRTVLLEIRQPLRASIVLTVGGDCHLKSKHLRTMMNGKPWALSNLSNKALNFYCIVSLSIVVFAF